MTTTFRLFNAIVFLSCILLLQGMSQTERVTIKAGSFDMGCTKCNMPDALPIHKVMLDAFEIAQTVTSNTEFKAFVDATSYVTTAEQPLDPKDFPGVPKDKLKSGSTLFKVPTFFRGLWDHLSWWEYKVGASWKLPQGPKGPPAQPNYPVVHVSYSDAEAYCKWRKGRLPTEAEFEFAARGGLKGKAYSWGDKIKPKGKWVANIWQGTFPLTNSKEDGYEALSPIKAFPPNGYGLYDMGGNVWQWTSDWYRPDYFSYLAKQDKPAKNPRGPTSSIDPQEPGTQKKVQKGGSHLCSDRYCSRYYVGSRGRGEVSTGSGHLSFRCAWDRASEKNKTSIKK